MYRTHAGHMSRPPTPNMSLLVHVPLTLRTTIPPTQNAPRSRGHPSTSSSTAAPKPIPPEKFKRALVLYTKYYMAKYLDQQAQQPQSAVETTNNNLNIPQPARARSLTSRGSSRAYTPSISNSDYDGVTDITDVSTVISFGEESHVSGPELFNFSGEVVKQRVRRPLEPVAKAKAALIRHLKSCDVCSARRVGCDLEHHDIASLERARRNKERRKRAATTAQQSRPTISVPLHNGSRSAPSTQTGNTTGQNEFFLGIGQQDELVVKQSSTPAPADPLSPGADILSDFSMPSFNEIPSVINDIEASFAATQPTEPIMKDVFPLGVFRNDRFRCMRFDMLFCQDDFETAEDLETHFETHFAYTRISPADFYVCSNPGCGVPSPSFFFSCATCGYEGTPETWIYGRCNQAPTLQRGPERSEIVDNKPTPWYPGMEFGNVNPALEFDLDDEMGNGNDSSSTNGNNFFIQDRNSSTFNSPSSHGRNETGYATPRSGVQANWPGRV